MPPRGSAWQRPCVLWNNGGNARNAQRRVVRRPILIQSLCNGQRYFA